jgi:hypothetical protein
MNIALWIVAFYLAGALITAVLATDWRGDEVTALAWPVTIPLGWVLKKWRHWRSTCRICGRYYGQRARLVRHLQVAHDPAESVLPSDEQAANDVQN